MAGCRSAHQGSIVTRPQVDLPAVYVVPAQQTVDAVCDQFYGRHSHVTIHCLWRANPGIRNRGWLKPDEKLVIPVLPDQTSPLKAGDVITLVMSGIVDPPYGEGDMTVSEDGTVMLPLLGPVHVAKLSPTEAEGRIEDAYIRGGYFRKMDLILTRVQQTGGAATSAPMPGRAAELSQP